MGMSSGTPLNLGGAQLKHSDPQLHHHGEELARLLHVEEGITEETKKSTSRWTDGPVAVFLALLACILLFRDDHFYFPKPEVGHGHPEKAPGIIVTSATSANESFRVLWQMKALTMVLLSSTVTQTVHLEDQSLLVLRAPCDATLFLQSLHLTVPHTGPQFWASPASPWECVHAPGTPEEERTSVRVVAAKGYLIYVRCALPQREPPAGSAATLVIRKSDEEEWKNGGKEGLGSRWTWLQSNLNEMNHGLLLGDLSKQLQMPAKECSLATVEDLKPAGGFLVPSVAAVARNWNNSKGTESARRQVMESMPQHDVIILSTRGVVFPKGKDRKPDKQRQGNFTCEFGNFWSGPSVWSYAGLWGTVACPYPPPEVVEEMVKGSDMVVAQGVSDDVSQPEDASSPLLISVPLTLKDKEGSLPSSAYFHPKAPRPEPWRDENKCIDFDKKKTKRSLFSRLLKSRDSKGKTEAKVESGVALANKSEEKKRESFLCSCTQIWHKAKFLEEWVRYHAWMGVEHFIIYDNNSDDDLMQVLLRLAKTVTHPSAYDQVQPQSQMSSNGSKDLTAEVWEKEVKITVVPWPWIKTQEVANTHCLLLAGGQCDWLLSHDVDEFFYPSFAEGLTTREQILENRAMRGPFLPSLLNGQKENGCPQNGSFRTRAVEFGPSGHSHHPPEGVTQGYSCRRKAFGQGKSIVRPSALQEGLPSRVHSFDMDKGYVESPDSYKTAMVFHYKQQAWPEYKEKFYRRNSGGISDWLTRTVGQTRGDGVVLEEDRHIRPPLDFAQRSCEVTDTRLARLVGLLFSRNVDGEYVLPWQT